jgi:cyclophilin family peptidyl-prolyl cis-trans isomerase
MLISLPLVSSTRNAASPRKSIVMSDVRNSLRLFLRVHACVSTCVSAMLLASVCAQSALAQTPPPTSAPAPAPSYGQVIEQSSASDWRTPDPNNLIYLELKSGRVVIELAPHVAPINADNFRKLAREKYFDGLAIVRSQDNYVVQWADPDEKNPRAIKTAQRTVKGEPLRALNKADTRAFAFDVLPDRDGYAPEVGFSQGFWAGRDVSKDKESSSVWLAHCYGAVGVGRGNDMDSGGAQFYVVTGHAPRHLDKNITLVGRVLQGMSLLSTLPRGTRPLGFYATPAEHVPIVSIRVAADVPEKERVALEVIRTDTPLFTRAVEALRNRGGDWFKVPAGHVELCNVPIAVREKKAQ